MTAKHPAYDTAHSSHLCEPGCWRQILTAPLTPSGQRTPALFLDRDGVMNADTGYVGDPETVTPLTLALTAICRADGAGVPVIIVTNQSGIGRGYYGWSDFQAVNARIMTFLAASKARLDAIYACAYHKDAPPPFKREDHPWRKPNPGMLHAAAQDFYIDLSGSILIGDSLSDMEAARNAGLKAGLLLTDNDQPLRKAPAFSQEGGHQTTTNPFTVFEVGRDSSKIQNTLASWAADQLHL